MFGPHMEEGCLYFGGDGRESTVSSSQIPMTNSDPPAWLVADWMFAHSRGEPLSENALARLNSCSQSSACRWLAGMSCR